MVPGGCGIGNGKNLRIKPLLIAGWGALAWWVYARNQPGQVGMSYFWCFGLFFLGGILLASVKLSHKLLVVACIAVAALFYLKVWLIALAILVPITVICFGKASFPVVRRFGKFGDLSYGVYIFAFPTQQTIVHFLGADTPFYILFLCALVITYGLAYVSWHFIEAPAQKLKKRLYPKA